jgi:hypothetical protein
VEHVRNKTRDNGSIFVFNLDTESDKKELCADLTPIKEEAQNVYDFFRRVKCQQWLVSLIQRLIYLP